MKLELHAGAGPRKLVSVKSNRPTDTMVSRQTAAAWCCLNYRRVLATCSPVNEYRMA